MKKRISVRLLTALGGLALLALGACAAAEGFFGVSVTACIGELLASSSAAAVLVKLAGIILLAVLACAAVLCALPARRQTPSEFVMQRGENGMIGISIRAIEKQVRACVAKHDEFADVEVAIRECRDGLIILLNVDQVSGVNIPLSVGLLQRQIKQYVAGCTGVDVHEVRVMVENNTSVVVASPYAVEDPVTPVQHAVTEEPRAAETSRPMASEPAAPAAEPANAAPVAPAASAVPVAAPVVLPELPPISREPEMQVEDERPLHQRIFGAEEQPVFVPAPPVVPEEAAVSEPEATMDREEPEKAGNEEAVTEEAAAEPEDVDAFPDEAAEAGAAYSEALWTDDASALQAVEAETCEEADLEEDEEARETPLNLLD